MESVRHGLGMNVVIEINYSAGRPRLTNPTNEGNEPEDEHQSLRDREERRGEGGGRTGGGKQNSLLGFSSGELGYYGLIVRGGGREGEGEEYVRLQVLTIFRAE